MSRELMIALIMDLAPPSNELRTILEAMSDATLKDLVSYWMQRTQSSETDDDCEHTDEEDGYCLDCGYCLLEDKMARAYDDAKDRRKYKDC